MSFLRMQEFPKSLIIWGFRDKPGMTVSTDLGLLIQPKTKIALQFIVGSWKK